MTVIKHRRTRKYKAYQKKWQKKYRKSLTADKKLEIKRNKHKWYLKNKKRVNAERRTYSRTVKRPKGIKPGDKCINGCHVPWYILEKSHLTNKDDVLMCPNCHAKYHWKSGKKRTWKKK